MEAGQRISGTNLDKCNEQKFVWGDCLVFVLVHANLILHTDMEITHQYTEAYIHCHSPNIHLYILKKGFEGITFTKLF